LITNSWIHVIAHQATPNLTEHLGLGWFHICRLLPQPSWRFLLYWETCHSKKSLQAPPPLSARQSASPFYQLREIDRPALPSTLTKLDDHPSNTFSALSFVFSLLHLAFQTVHENDCRHFTLNPISPPPINDPLSSVNNIILHPFPPFTLPPTAGNIIHQSPSCYGRTGGPSAWWSAV
jgi:hypothetical protein